MAIAKAVVTGTVFRAPEKRYTQNNVPVSSFVLNIGEREETLLRILVKRTSLDEVVSELSQNDRVLVEGRLQITTVKNENGAERKIFEIDANAIEQLSGTVKISSAPKASNSEDIVKFASEDFSNELIGEEEIPF